MTSNTKSATPTQTPPKLRELRAEIERLGITEETCEMPIDDLIAHARIADDPFAYLAAFADQESGVRGQQSNPQSPIPNPSPESLTISVDLPLIAGEVIGYIPHCFHVDCRLGAREGEAFVRLQRALAAEHAQLDTGKHVESRGDVLRWLLARVAEKMTG